MFIPNKSLSSSFRLLLLLLIFTTLFNGSDSTKLEKTTGSLGSSDLSVKCGSTCYLSPPPPPPPKKHHTPSTRYYCPPPPPSPPGFVYMNAPPGSLYPIVQSYSGSGRVFGTSFGSGFLGILLIIWLL